MKIYVGQIYIEVGAKFDFNYIFQKYMHTVLSKYTEPSEKFITKYKDYELMFRMSAKIDIDENEIRGPSNFRKTKDIEYSIFLPYSVIMKNKDYNYRALRYLFKGIYQVYDKYDFKYEQLKEREEEIINTIIGDKNMFYDSK